MHDVEPWRLEQQKRLEVEMSEMGVERYREALKSKDVGDTDIGKATMLETIEPVAKAFTAHRAELMTLSGGGRPEPYEAYFCAHDPEQLAVMAVCTLLGGTAWKSATKRLMQGDVTSIPHFSEQLADAMQAQADYDRWAAEQEAAQKVAAAPLQKELRKAKSRKNEVEIRRLTGLLKEVREDELLRQFRAQNPNANRRSWERFASRQEIARTTPMPISVAVQLGGAVAKMMAEACPKWFTLAREVGEDGSRATQGLCLTDRAVDRMMDAQARAEVARPKLLPLIVPPRPWAYEEAA